MITAVDLPRLHTRQLLKALRSTRATASRTDGLINDLIAMRGLTPESQSADDGQTIVSGWWLGSPHADSTVTVAQLKAELAKRPHVPNKQESKAIRQAKALRNRQKGRGDR